MSSIGGIVVVFVCVIAGFLMEKGQIAVLLQPAELLIIGGAAIGTVLTANPIRILKKIVIGLVSIVKGAPFPRARYLDTLKMMFDLLAKSRKEGANHHVRDFVCDTMRMVITGGVSAFDLDQMMELDMDVHHQTENQPCEALSTMADALPGLGIVAAVLGIVVTMGALGGPAEEIGRKVASALVGTFLGILLCYGLVGPLSSNMTKIVEEEQSYYHVLRVMMIAFIKGTAPILAVEMGRRAIPEHIRPSFFEVEKACREKVGEPVAESEAA